jgi:hypothetical protein
MSIQPLEHAPNELKHSCATQSAAELCHYGLKSCKIGRHRLLVKLVLHGEKSIAQNLVVKYLQIVGHETASSLFRESGYACQ